MNKEELTQDAIQFAKYYSTVFHVDDFLIYEAFLKVAEPREKQILELQKDKGNLIDRCRELEQQIEKMKRCAICKHSTDLGYCKIRCSGGECDNHSSWEIKENE